MRLGTHPYLQAREFGVSHDQFCEAHRVLGWTGANGVRLAGRDLRSYIDCLKEGATHGEALDAARAGLNLHNYADGRYYGLDHEAAKGRARSVLYPPADS
jgi:hypothetical protein